MRRRGDDEFQLGKYRLGREAKRPNVYAYWYDAGRRKIRRKSLGTNDWEAAKQALITWRGVTLRATERAPGDASLLLTLEAYFTEKTDHLPSADPARRAGELIRDYWGAHARVPDATPQRQRAFMHWCRDTHGHAVTTISRNLSVLNAALERATREGDLSLAPRVVYAATTVAAELKLPDPLPREWIPTIEGLGAFLDALSNRPHILKYIIATLNTAARPGVMLDLHRGQVDRRHGLVDLNPAGRRQTKKYRPVVRITETLGAWFDAWRTSERFVEWGGRPVVSTKKAVRRAAHDTGQPDLTRYSLRHFMATEMRRRGVAKDEIQLQLGHRVPEFRTTDRYIKFDPAFLANATRAIDETMTELQAHTKKPLRAPTAHPQAVQLSNRRATK